MKKTNKLLKFRNKLYQNFTQRADAALDLLDALSSATVVESPVALSESTLFRRQHHSIYDTLEEVEFEKEALSQMLYEAGEGYDTIADYEIYATDCTPNPRPESPTVEDAGYLKSGKNKPTLVGHKLSWLVRLAKRETSWGGPIDVERVATKTTDSEVAAVQVNRLDKMSDRLKVVVGDSLYGNDKFLATFLLLTTVFALVRLRSNRVLYEKPGPYCGRGRRPKHGAKFKLSNENKRQADQTDTIEIGRFTVRLQAWEGLHFYKLSQLVGMVICIEFLKTDGTPRYKRPIWLFWTGPTTVPLADLCHMYLWRFGIEHMFRFLKQHLGLCANQSTALINNQNWYWFCALANWQLLLMQDLVAEKRPAWYPKYVNGRSRPLTPRLVQRGALGLLLTLGTPAKPPQPAGKGIGRANGYRPQPRQRYKVVRKGKKKAKSTT